MAASTFPTITKFIGSPCTPISPAHNGWRWDRWVVRFLGSLEAVFCRSIARCLFRRHLFPKFTNFSFCEDCESFSELMSIFETFLWNMNAVVLEINLRIIWFVSICLLGWFEMGSFCLWMYVEMCCRGVLYPLSHIVFLLVFGLSISCLCHILSVSVHQLLLELCSGFYLDLSITLVPNQGGIGQILSVLFWFYHKDS